MAGYRGGFGGGFGGGNQMQQLMKQAQKMQEQMAKAQEELEEAEIVGESGGGLVQVVVNGKKTVLNLIHELNETFYSVFGSIHFLIDDFYEISINKIKVKSEECRNQFFIKLFKGFTEKKIGVWEVINNQVFDNKINENTSVFNFPHQTIGKSKQNNFESVIEWKRLHPIYLSNVLRGFDLLIKFKGSFNKETDSLFEIHVESIEDSLSQQDEQKQILNRYHAFMNSLNEIQSDELLILNCEKKARKIVNDISERIDFICGVLTTKDIS